MERLVLLTGALSACANVIAWPLLAGLLQVSVFLFTGREVARTEARRAVGWTYCPFFIAGSLAMLKTGLEPPAGPEDLQFLAFLRLGAMAVAGVLLVVECRQTWRLRWVDCLLVLGAPALLYGVIASLLRFP